jgi:hypothetical protein
VPFWTCNIGVPFPDECNGQRHLQVGAHQDFNHIKPSSSNVPRRQFWMPYVIQSWHNLVRTCVVFHRRIFLKYDISFKKRLDVLEGSHILYSSTWIDFWLQMINLGLIIHVLNQVILLVVKWDSVLIQFRNVKMFHGKMLLTTWAELCKITFSLSWR